jgi:hypothetical protein
MQYNFILMNEPLFQALNYVLSEILIIQSKDIANNIEHPGAVRDRMLSRIVTSALMRTLLPTVHPASTNDSLKHLPAVSAEDSLFKFASWRTHIPSRVQEIPCVL